MNNLSVRLTFCLLLSIGGFYKKKLYKHTTTLSKVFFFLRRIILLHVLDLTANEIDLLVSKCESQLHANRLQ